MSDLLPLPVVVGNGWTALRRYTPARIALGRSGISVPTAPQLAFQLAHAQARDAVHRPLDHERLAAEIEALGLATLSLHSAAADRHVYLQRPDLGRRLDDASRALLAARPPAARVDLALVVADGLSALAIERHAVPFIAALRQRLGGGAAGDPLAAGGGADPAASAGSAGPAASAAGWSLAPVAIVRQGRVAVGDEVGERLGADLVVMLIGERPGLSSPDSMGLYLTWEPKVGRTDAERNCISNVRPEGQDIPAAADRLVWLMRESRSRRLTGVALKDESAPDAALAGRTSANFLLAED